MEENKKVNEVQEAPASTKVPYEVLEDMVRNLQKRNAQLEQGIQQLNDARGIKRIEFLFKVLEYTIEFDADTVAKTVKEIKESLFGPEGEAENTVPVEGE